jgi:hypothetical protein
MEDQKADITEILKRIDELTRILRFLLGDLTEISKNLKTALSANSEELQSNSNTNKIFFSKSSQQTLKLNEETAEDNDINHVKNVFPQELVDLLKFEKKDSFLIIKPKQYLGSDFFRKIALVVREKLNGEYVSAGRNSHFRISKKNR